MSQEGTFKRQVDPPTTEHRFLSVLFCDMVDSTGHQFGMEPEAFAALLSAYRQAVFEVVRRHGGYVARVIGDGVLAYFGWPRAAGRDAQAAVSCGLAIGRRIARLEAIPPVAVRVAIETGWVLVGEIGETGTPGADPEHDGVVGPAPHIAAKLQRFAQPNGVIVGEGTLPLLGQDFVTTPADTTGLQLPRPVRAVHVLAEAGGGDPLARLRAHRGGSVFNRDDERATLRARWQLARQGFGQMVLLSGDPGIGKSRLIADLLNDIEPHATAVIALFSRPDATDSPFRPLEEPLRAAMALTQDAGPETIRLSAARFAERIGLPPQTGGMAFAFILGIPPPETLATAELRRLIFDALLTWISRLAATGTTVVLAEDIHWADASTLDFLRQLVERIATLGVLSIASCRSDYSVTWPSRPQMLQMNLGPLVAAAAEQLLDQVARDLDPELRQTILQRAEGVPLFIEEFARALTVPGGPARRLPGSLSQLLTARLDGLGSARSLAQLASVVGREVPTPLLRALSGLEPEGFASATDRLVDSGVMMHVGTGGKAVLAFRHALLGDAAYQALPTDRRRALHRQVATVLPSLEAVARPEVLGHHLAAAGDAHAATIRFREATAAATASGAFVEARGHAQRALELAESLDADAGHPAVLAALSLLGYAQLATLGYANSEAQATYERAARMALARGTAHDLLPALRGMISFYQVRGPLARARDLCDRLLQLARVDGNLLLIAEAERRLGWCRFCQGALTEARSLFETALARLDKARANGLDIEAESTGTLALAHLSWLDWLTQDDAAALRRAAAVVRSAEQTSRPIVAAYGIGFAAAVHQLTGDAEGARELANRCGEIARPRGIAYWAATAELLCGWSDTQLGQPQAGIERLRAGLAAYRHTESEILRPYALILLAEAADTLGAKQEALDALDEAMAVSDEVGSFVFPPLLHYTRARMLRGAQREAARMSAESGAKALQAWALARRAAELTPRS